MGEHIADLVGRVLGPPKRYVYSSKPIVVYVNNDGNLERVKGYSVDFEVACDMKSVDDAKGEACLYNPHLVNIVEPGLDGSEINAKISHSIFLDEKAYERLLSVSNTDGKLHKYKGVVEGYSVRDIKRSFNLPELTDTGVCISDKMLGAGCVKRPDVPFNEVRHRRFVQASESYHIKLRKHTGKAAVSKIYRPEIFGFNQNFNLEQMATCDY